MFGGFPAKGFEIEGLAILYAGRFPGCKYREGTELSDLYGSGSGLGSGLVRWSLFWIDG